jgi:outer membrane protein assembly factor BamB
MLVAFFQSAVNTSVSFVNAKEETSKEINTSIQWNGNILPSFNNGNKDYLVVCTVDGNILVLNAIDGSLVCGFPTGNPLIGPSSSLKSGRHIVPGLDGSLYVSLDTQHQQETILQPLEITVLDVLQNPVKTCSSSSPEKNQNDCGIVTATKATSLYALDSTSGQLIWHQTKDGITILSKSSKTSKKTETVLLQRDDIMVQQLSTESGDSVWNITLGTFQALEFESSSKSEELPGQNSLLLDAPPKSLSETSTTAEPKVEAEEEKDNSRHELPQVLFGSDGTTLTAVDPTTSTSLWNFQFETVVASVFGLTNKSWKPLTVLEKEEPPASTTFKEGTRNLLTDTDTQNTDTSETGIVLANPHQQNFKQKHYLQHLDWLYTQSQSLPDNKQDYPPIPDYFITSNQKSLALLPGPTDGPPPIAHKPPPIPTRSDGLFLTWPKLLCFLILLMCAIQYWYTIKKQQWYQDITEKATMDMTATSTDITHGVIMQPDSQKPPMRFTVHNQRTIHYQTQLSIDNDFTNSGQLPQPQVQNVNMMWVQHPPANSNDNNNNGTSPTDLNHSSPLAESIESSSLETSPQDNSNQGVGFFTNGIPLIRYARYDSEFTEILPLGKGGFGTVFQCKNVLDGRTYAIKKVCLFLNKEKESPEHFQQRLQRTLREVKSLALLDHPNIVRYYTAWLELDNSQETTETTLVATAEGQSDYYSFSPTNTATFSNNLDNNATTVSNPWRRPSLDHLHKVSDFNPLGGWSHHSEEFTEEIAFDYNIQGIPSELDDYGFTFDRSDENEDDDDKVEECDSSSSSSSCSSSSTSNNSDEISYNKKCTALVKYPLVSTPQNEGEDDNDDESSQNGLFLTRNRTSVVSIANSIMDDENTAVSRIASYNSLALVKENSNNNAVNENSKTSLVKYFLYIQMQFCSQKTLADFLSNPEARNGSSSDKTQVDIPHALRLSLQIAQGVKHVHMQGLIHRDLKPNNCFIDDVGVVKVGDFGLSRESGESTKEDEMDNKASIEDEPLVGDITAGVGTRSYASPEQMQGSDYDSSADVYSLGIILFELCYPMYTVSCFGYRSFRSYSC